MSRTRHFLALALCVGCAREVTLFEGSPTDGANAVILVVLYPGDVVEAHAIDLSADTAGVVLSDGTDAELVAMSLERDLAYYRLESGPLPLSRGGARPWPQPMRSHRSTVTNGVQSEWAVIRDLPGRITELSIDLEPLSACDVGPVGFDVSSHELPTKYDGLWAARYDERTALLMTAKPEYFLVTPEGVATASVAGEPFGPMYQAPNGDVYVADVRGVWRAPLGSLAFERIGPGRRRQIFLAAIGPSDPSAPFEMFVLAGDGQVDRFDGTSWTVHGSAVRTDHGDLYWEGPGHVVVAREAVPYLERIDQGASTSEEIFEGFIQGITEVDRFEPYELIAGTRDGYVIARRDGAWRDLGPALIDFAFEIEPDRGSFVVAGSGGEVARWVEGFGFCTDLLAPSHVHRMLPLAGGYFVVMTNRDSWAATNVEEKRFPTPVSWLFPR